MSGLQIIIEPLKLSPDVRRQIVEFLSSDIFAQSEDPTSTFACVPSQSVVMTENVVSMPKPEVLSDFDAEGLPWDDRIHSSSKSRTEDGRWRKKRGVADDVFEQVTAELKALMAIPAAVVPPPAPAAVEANREGYIALITKASAAIGAKRIVKEELDAICATVGVSSLPLLANRLDLVPSIYSALDALLAGK